MGLAGYERVKNDWRTFAEIDVNPRDVSFTGMQGFRTALLQKVANIPGMSTSVFELGPMYNPMVKDLLAIGKHITTAHFSDPIYSVHGHPDDIPGVQVSSDADGLPQVKGDLSRLGLGDTTVVLESVVNYATGGDIKALLKPREGYRPNLLLFANNFDASMDEMHYRRIKSNRKFLYELMKLGARL